MSYTKTTPLNQGTTKLSEIAVDRAQSLHSSPTHASALPLIEQMVKTSADLLRRQNYFLKSEGKIIWNGTQIRFDESSVVNNIIFDILQTENPSQPKISLRMNGTLGAPTPTTFNNIPMASGDLLYLELDPAIILAGGTDIVIENAVNGGSTVNGKTLRKTTLAAGMPTITSAVPQDPGPTPASTTFYVPLCYISGTDIQWIPHGITWPAGTSSILGAIIVDGFQALPERFVGSESQFASALNDMLNLGGGIILLTDSFGITQDYTIPPNTKVLGRGRKIAITVSQPHQIIMSQNTELQDFSIICAANYQTDAVVMNGKRAKIRNIVFDITQPADLGPISSPSFTFNASDGNKFGGSNPVVSIVTQPDGKVLAAGVFTNYNGQTGKSRLIRFNPDGTEDVIFSANAVVDGNTPRFSGPIDKVALQADGKILIVGNFTNYSGQTGKSYLIRLNPDGTEDTAFSANAVVNGNTPRFNNTLAGLFVQSDGKIIVSGNFTNYNGQTGKSYLIRLNPDGTEDTAFSANAVVDGNTPRFNGASVDFAQQSDDKIIAVGGWTNYSGQTGKNHLIRLNPDGTEDTAFSANAVVNGNTPRFNNSITVTAVQPDGKIIVGGTFTNYSGQTGKNHLIRFNPGGTEDTAFSANAVVNGNTPRLNSTVRSIAFNPSRILIGGNFTNYQFPARNVFAGMEASGVPEGQIVISPPPPNATGVKVQASHCRIYEAWFLGTASANYKTAVNFFSGTDNAAVDCLFE